MNWKKTFAIIRREYIERVRTKAFWIATLLIPILFLGYVAIQIAISRKTGGERKLVVLDPTGTLYAPLTRELAELEARQKQEGSGSRGPHWDLQQRPVQGTLEATKEALRKQVLEKTISGYLVLDPELLKKEEVEYFSTTVSDYIALNQLQSAVNRVWMRQKMARRGLPPELTAELEKSINLRPFKVTEKGTAEEKGAGISDGPRLPHPHVLDVLHVRLPGHAGSHRGEEHPDRRDHHRVGTPDRAHAREDRGHRSRRPDPVFRLVARRDEPVPSRHRHGSAAGRRPGRAAYSVLDARLLHALLHPRLFPLRRRLHGHRGAVQYRPGSAAAGDDSHDHDRRRNRRLPGRHEQPERRCGALLLALSPSRRR